MRPDAGDAPSKAGAAHRRWCDGLPAATAEIACGGQRHHITWRRGKLVLEDHDVLAERSLTALGSEPPLCVEVLDAWRRVRGTELLLYGFLLADRPLPQPELERRRQRHKAEMASAIQQRLHMPQPLGSSPHGSALRSAWERRLAARSRSEKRMWDISLMEALPAALRRALALSVVVSVERHWHDEAYRRAHGEHARIALAAIVNGLLEQSARRWRRNIRPYARFEIEARVLTRWEQPACWASLGTCGASAVLSLPLSWFIEIWARDLALVDGCFVLSRAGPWRPEGGIPVTAIRWEREARRRTSRSIVAPAIVTRGTGAGWSLRWT